MPKQKPIILKPCATDYKTFIETTRKALGADYPGLLSGKPSQRALALMATPRVE